LKKTVVSVNGFRFLSYTIIIYLLYSLTNFITLKKIIYVVEDNDDIRELIEYLFESEDFIVTSFANATDFKRHIIVDQPAVIVLDVMLPDGNGVDICNQLKTNEATAAIPVLLMSANTNVAYVGAESKADDFISKPFDIDELVKRVNKLAN
jgi:two-component system phosphate regulon response regulator PhoB